MCYNMIVCYLCTYFARRDPAGGVGVVGGFKYSPPAVACDVYIAEQQLRLRTLGRELVQSN